MNPLKKNYNKLEKNEAKKDNVSLVKNSGRGFEKGDAKIDQFLIDYKFNAKSFQLSLVNWKKLTRDAWNEDHRSPIISIKFEDGTKLAILDWNYFIDYLEIKNE
jgi:hypothetical protein